MARPRAEILLKLREQMQFLRNSLQTFYSGNFAESVRIATTIRVLVHETGRSKPLLKQATPNGLQLPILDQKSERLSEDEIFSFAVSVRLEPTIAPAVDLGSSHYSPCSIGAWWNRIVFSFPRFGKQLIHRRKDIILILANKEGGAHVDEDLDRDYERLMNDSPLSFGVSGVRLDTPDLARFLTAQSGAEMLECLKRNFFPDEDVPLKWEVGTAPPIARYMDRISITQTIVVPAFPMAEMKMTTRK
jgi:hypothetical protein